MTQKEKDLLFIELSARLHYGVKVQTPLFENSTSIKGIAEDECWIYSDEDNYEWINIEEVKPYLRPMSSMTEKEKRKYDILVEEIVYRPGVLTCSSLINFCHEHHLDDLGLIEKGLAFVAPKDMYKTE